MDGVLSLEGQMVGAVLKARQLVRQIVLCCCPRECKVVNMRGRIQPSLQNVTYLTPRRQVSPIRGRENIKLTHVLGSSSFSPSRDSLYESPLSGNYHERPLKADPGGLTKQPRFPGSSVRATANPQSRGVGTLQYSS